jgi:hypothetical protein
VYYSIYSIVCLSSFRGGGGTIKKFQRVGYTFKSYIVFRKSPNIQTFESISL